ncbi:hypothetical protein U729_3242 (plasmid) [Clostridium baratii str. Sullivan]|uniref:Uncharacterized protein n=2 Tax=Clostridium baratii TaxID=1561 RepID=A0A0A7G0I0_9CLOT|nr:hypothetical protein U729_3242 [Clostridium baratii str. Sullivan]
MDFIFNIFRNILVVLVFAVITLVLAKIVTSLALSFVPYPLRNFIRNRGYKFASNKFNYYVAKSREGKHYKKNQQEYYDNMSNTFSSNYNKNEVKDTNVNFKKANVNNTKKQTNNKFQKKPYKKSGVYRNSCISDFYKYAKENYMSYLNYKDDKKNINAKDSKVS